MAGKLNGIGGKLESGEFAPAAMVREFHEEVELDIPHQRWRTILVLTEQTLFWRVHFLTATAVDEYEFTAAQTVTDEEIEPWIIDNLWRQSDVVNGLKYQLALALDNSWLVLPVCLENRPMDDKTGVARR